MVNVVVCLGGGPSARIALPAGRTFGTGGMTTVVRMAKSDRSANRTSVASPSAGTGDVAWSRGRKIGLITVLVVWLSVSALIVVTSLRSSAPPPDAVAGPFTQQFPAIRLAIAALLAFAALALLAVRARLVDTPVLELAGARPGRALYRGTVHATPPVIAPLTSTSCAWYRTLGGTRKERTLRSQASPSISIVDSTGSVDLDPAMLIHGPNRRVVYERMDGALQEERVLPDGGFVTVYADCRLGEDGGLVLEETRWSPVARLQRNGVMGDGDGALFLLRAASTILLVAAWVMWMALWLVQTWETAVGSKSAMVLPREPLRTAVVVVICTLAFAVAVSAVVIANRLIVLRNQITYSAAVITTAAQQRHDLIGSLLGGVDGVTDHERTTLAGVALVRADLDPRAQVARAEATPELTSNPLFRHLMEQLVACENRLAAARRFHNDAVTVAKDRSGTFPNLLLRPLVFPRGLPPLLTFDLL
jgi:LemA protein